MAEVKKYTEVELIEAAKYGYDYHKTSQFPELEFEEMAVNNFKLIIEVNKVKGIDVKYYHIGEIMELDLDDDSPQYYIKSEDYQSLTVERDRMKAELRSLILSGNELAKQADDLMDFCIDRGHLDNEDVTEGQLQFNESRDGWSESVKEAVESLKESEGRVITGSHKELITCPNCEHVQEAKVEHTSIWNIYVHDCDKCKYLIMESEWNPLSKDRT